MRPIVWCIGGTDPDSGAGVSADLRVCDDLGVHGASVVTTVVAQNTFEVRRVDPLPAAVVSAQLEALRADLPPVAVKIGLLGSLGAARAVAECLRELGAFVVLDPVWRAGSGEQLMPSDLESVLFAELMLRTDVFLPNLAEARELTGMNIRSPADMEEAARRLLAMGPKAVYLKGGHASDSELTRDFWLDSSQSGWLMSPRIAQNFHGTGCALSSAVACFLALGHRPLEAVVLAKAYLNCALRAAEPMGRGRYLLRRAGWPTRPDCAPWLTRTPEIPRFSFPPCDVSPIGLYPLVERAAWVERLGSLGVPIVQLRIKDLAGAELEREVEAACQIARKHGIRLVINDWADLATRFGAWGVHLGQEDLQDADLGAIAGAGLRLGVSVHNYVEMARALAFRPSYISVGPVFSSSSKTLSYLPLGLEKLSRLRTWSPVPVVAIGGITLESGPSVLETGVDGVAVIADIRDAPDPDERVKGWQRLFASRRETI